MHTRKGEIELQYVILFILAIIVLVTLLVFFRAQVFLFFDQIFSVSKELNQTRPPIKDLINAKP